MSSSRPPSAGSFLSGRPSGSVVWWLVVVVAIAASSLLVHGVWQATSIHRGSGDLTTVFAASRAWLRGEDPYDMRQLLRQWDAAGGIGVAPEPHRAPSVYPPSTFVVMAPLATLTWPQARVVWTVLDVAMVLAIVLAVPALSRVPWSDARAPALAAGIFLLGAFRAGLRVGQPAVVGCALVVCSALASQRRLDRTAGVMLALACALKPPLAAPFVAYHALRRRWRLVTTAGVLAAAIMLLGVIRLQAADVTWLDGLRRNLSAAAAPGATNDPTPWNPARFQLVNLHVLLHTVIDSREMVGLLVTVLTALGAIAFARLVWRRPAGDDHGSELAELAFVASWALLPVYHRFYDAGVLVFVLAWCAAAWPRQTARHARVAVVLVISFVISPLWLARVLPRPEAPPYRYVPGIEQLVLPMQVWTLVLLCVLLLHVLSRRARQGDVRGC